MGKIFFLLKYKDLFKFIMYEISIVKLCINFLVLVLFRVESILKVIDVIVYV